jgi:hypothetical protein
VSRLAPGELRVLATLDGGAIGIYERPLPDGSVERGVLRPVGSGGLPEAQGLVEMGEQVRPGVFRPTVTPFTARGPASVTSNAYRSGWDAVFGERKRACGAN